MAYLNAGVSYKEAGLGKPGGCANDRRQQGMGENVCRQERCPFS